MPFFKACSLSALSAEKPIKCNVDGLDVLLVKSADGSVWAFDAICTHEDKPLEKGRWDAQNAQITCPFHKTTFAIAQNGAVLSPPACVNLAVYKNEVRNENGEDCVFVYLD